MLAPHLHSGQWRPLNFPNTNLLMSAHLWKGEPPEVPPGSRVWAQTAGTAGGGGEPRGPSKGELLEGPSGTLSSTAPPGLLPQPSLSQESLLPAHHCAHGCFSPTASAPNPRHLSKSSRTALPEGSEGTQAKNSAVSASRARGQQSETFPCRA